MSESVSVSEIEAKIAAVKGPIDAVRAQISRAIVGQSQMVDRLLIGLLCNGHILLEGVPGLAKTTAVQALSKALQLDFRRIQFTPDLLPSDLLGTQITTQRLEPSPRTRAPSSPMWCWPMRSTGRLQKFSRHSLRPWLSDR